MNLKRRTVELDPADIDPDAWERPNALLASALRLLADEIDELEADALTARVVIVEGQNRLGFVATVEERPPAFPRLRLIRGSA